MGFENTFGTKCYNCHSENLKDLGNNFKLCLDCGFMFNDLLDYSLDFCESDTKYQQELNFGFLRCFFSLSFIGRDEIAGAAYNMILSSDNKENEGFSLSDKKTFKDLCLSIVKWKHQPDPSYITKHKHVNPFNDSICEVNIFDTLGAFGIDINNCNKPTIQLDADEIRKNNYADGIIILTILHEIMHAAMYVEHPKFSTDYFYYKEESYANAFALKLLSQSENHKWFEEALDFVKKQPEGYNAGAKLFDKDISMEVFRKEKSHPDTVSTEEQSKWMLDYIKD